MGTDKSDNMVQGSSPIKESDNMVEGSEQEKELSEVLGGLRNGDGFSSIENQGLGDDGVVEVVKSDSSSVLETKVSVLSENDCQVLADSELSRFSSWLNEPVGDIGTEYSSDAAEKLEYLFASEGIVVDDAVSNLDGLEGVGGEDEREGGKSEEEGKNKDCEENIVTVASESIVADAAVLDVDGLVGVGGVGGEDERDGGKSEEERKDEDNDGNTVTVASESRVAEADVLSWDGLIGVDGGESEEEVKEDCDGNAVIIASESGFNVDGSIGIGGEDRRDGGNSEEKEKEKDEDCVVDVVIVASESIVAEAVLMNVDSLVGVDGEDKRDGVNSEEKVKDEDCDGNLVTIEVPIAETSDSMDVETEDLSDVGYGFAVGDFVWGKTKGHLWWPGRVYDLSHASHIALKLQQKNRLLVAHYGDGTFAWCHPSQLKPFKENFDDMVQQNSSIAFVNAVQEAAHEFGRLLHIKMSHSFVARKTGSESALPVAKNSGIKEGVLVPEMLLDVRFEPAKLLSVVKKIAQGNDIGSILELEILKAQLSAFYLLKGGYKLREYMDPQPVPEVEDSPMDETVAVYNSNSAVEAPVQGPFDELDHSPGLSGNMSNHNRKQKSIAEIMGEDKDVQTENREGEATDEMVNATAPSGGKKRKGGEAAMAPEPVKKKKDFLRDTDGDVSGAENDGNRGKENRNTGTLIKAEERNEAFGNEDTCSGSKMENDEGKSMERKDKSYLSRERKKSKYLSPPFTTSTRGQSEGDVGKESLKVSGKDKASQRRAWAAGQCVPPVYKGRFFDSSDYQIQGDDGKKSIDPKKIQVPVEDILAQLCYEAVSPQIRREGTSLDQLVDFTYAFRSSLYSQGSLCKVNEKNQPGRKRKKPESEHGMLKDVNQSSPKQNSELKKRRKEAPNTGSQKGMDENGPGALLFVSFYSGSSIPSRSDLFSVYSKFGALNDAETDMFRTNHTARVSFLKTSDAEEALNHSQINRPFGSDVTFQLHFSDGSKSPEHTPLPEATPFVSLSRASESSKLIFIQKKLQGLTSMLEASGDKSPDMLAKLASEIKALLEDVNKMV